MYFNVTFSFGEILERMLSLTVPFNLVGTFTVKFTEDAFIRFLLHTVDFFVIRQGGFVFEFFPTIKAHVPITC